MSTRRRLRKPGAHCSVGWPTSGLPSVYACHVSIPLERLTASAVGRGRPSFLRQFAVAAFLRGCGIPTRRERMLVANFRIRIVLEQRNAATVGRFRSIARYVRFVVCRGL